MYSVFVTEAVVVAVLAGLCRRSYGNVYSMYV